MVERASSVTISRSISSLHAAILQASELDDVKPERAEDHLVGVVAHPRACCDERQYQQPFGVDAQGDGERDEAVVDVEAQLEGRLAQCSEPTELRASQQPRQQHATWC